MGFELLGDLVREGQKRHPSRLALVWRDQEISYLSLNGQIDAIADGLRRHGVEPGDRIALYMHNLPHFVSTLYAIQRAGAVAVPLNIYWQGRDLLYLLQSAAVDGVITIAPFFERFKALQDQVPHLRWVVAITPEGEQPTGSVSWEELTANPLSEPVQTVLDPLEPALLAFTGGRTGPSRPAVFSHFNLLANCQQMQDLAQAVFNTDLTQDEEEEEAGFVPVSYTHLTLPTT